MKLTAIALNCTLKGKPHLSSTDKLLREIAAELEARDVETEIVRVVDLNIKPGVRSDEGRGDAWPKLRRKILEARILVMGTPIWLGQPSSICKRVLERMDAFLDEKDPQGRMLSYGRVAGVAVVGNEDGAHHVSAELFQALNDVGFTIPAAAMTYWVGTAMAEVNYRDLGKTPRVVAKATAALASNLVHAAGLFAKNPYPSLK
jgi:multimeric flavodoxin WrbA